MTESFPHFPLNARSLQSDISVRFKMAPIRDMWLTVQKGPEEEKREDFLFLMVTSHQISDSFTCVAAAESTITRLEGSFFMIIREPEFAGLWHPSLMLVGTLVLSHPPPCLIPSTLQTGFLQCEPHPLPTTLEARIGARHVSPVSPPPPTPALLPASPAWG